MSRATSLGGGTYLSLGLRNLWRNPRRTLFTLASLLVGFGALTLLGAMNDGFTRDIRQNVVLMLTGHVQVHTNGFEASQQIQHYIADPEVVTQALAGAPEVAVWAHRVRTSGLASVAAASAGVQILGIDSVREAHLSRLAQVVASGTWLQAGDARGVLLGKTLAELLDVHLGDKVVLMAQTPTGDITTELFRLRGILRAGWPEVDQSLALVPLASAQRMLGLGRGVTDVVIRATRDTATDVIRDHLQATLSRTDYEVLRWQDLNPALKQRLEVIDIFAYFILLIVVVVVIAEILNVMLMALHERWREFGLMVALGTRQRQLFTMMVWESLLLLMIGCLAGYLFGALITLYFGRTGIDLSRYAEASALTHLNPTLYPILTWYTAVRIIGTTFVAALLAALYPAWQATRLHPVDAMRRL